MKTLLTLFVLFFSSSVVADDISDFEIEGISIGDSLLDYMTDYQIKKEIERNKFIYNYLSDELGEVYLFKDFEIYDNVSFFVKTDDPNYIIYAIHGNLFYDNKIEECYSEQKKITNEFDIILADKKKYEGHDTLSPAVDPTEISNMRWVLYRYENDDSISIECKEYEKSLKNKYPWQDALSVSIDTKEFNYWFGNF